MKNCPFKRTFITSIIRHVLKSVLNVTVNFVFECFKKQFRNVKLLQVGTGTGKQFQVPLNAGTGTENPVPVGG